MSLMLKVFLFVIQFPALLFGIASNSFLVVKLIKQKQSTKDVLPLNMAFADILAILSTLPGIIGYCVDVKTPIGFCVLIKFIQQIFYLNSYLSLFSYWLLKLSFIIWPFECLIYLQKSRMCMLITFNLLLSLFDCSDLLYVHWDLLTSNEITETSGWNRIKPVFYEVTGNVFLCFYILLMLILAWLIVFATFRLAKKADTDDANKCKKQAIHKISVCFFVFVFLRFGTLALGFTWRIIYGELNEFNKLLETILLISCGVNPFLYYETKRAVGLSSKSLTSKQQAALESTI